MQTISVYTDSIEVGERHRSLDEDAVTRLMASMKDIGLRQPISIRVVELMEIDGKEVEGVPVLVAGRHRLEAAKRLEWERIDCIEVEDDPISAELWEIAENLHRLDLTKEQRDEQIRRYAKLLREREVSRQIDAKPKSSPQGGRPEGIASKVAKETGLSKRTVERALNPRSSVVPIKSAIEPESEEEATIREANAIVAAWNRARQAARELALEQIDSPVFDRTVAGR